MSVYKDSKRGTWYVSYKEKDPVTGKYVHHSKRGFKTKKEASKWEHDIQHPEAAKPVKSKLTFHEVADQWADYIQASSESRRQHREHFQYRFAKYYDEPIGDISKLDLTLWRNELAKTSWTTTTKNMTICYVRSVFAFASEMYDIPNVSTVLKRLKKTNEEIMNDESSVWTPEEFELFSNCIEDRTYKAFFQFLYWTGCRRGEAIALQKGDISDHFVLIRYSQRDSTTGLRPTKTKQIRKIEIDDTLWQDIQPLIEENGPYLFGGVRALSPTSIDRYFRAGIEASGVSKIRLHDLRHSHATWLINNGVNIVAVSKRLGHSTIEQTLKTYTHLLENSDQQMMDKINQNRGINLRPNTLEVAASPA